MRKYFDFVQSGTSGRAVSGASVTVTTYPAGTTASLFTDAAGTIPASNPITTDKTGYYEFYTADGAYNLQFSGAGMTTETITNVQIYDITDVPLTSSLAASSGSSLVGFLQAGTGAVARTMQSKAREIVSVLDFGAVGDGVTDDTVAINNAITYVNSLGGGTVQLDRAKTYLISPLAGGINCCSNLVLDLNWSTLRKATNGLATYQVVSINNVENVVVKNGFVKGDRYTHDYSSGGTHEFGMGIQAINARHICIERVHASECTGDGLLTGFARIAYYRTVAVSGGGIVAGGINADGSVNASGAGYYTPTKMLISDVTGTWFHLWARNFARSFISSSATIVVYYYTAGGTFISSSTYPLFEMEERISNIPAGATQVALAFPDWLWPMPSGALVDLGSGAFGCFDVVIDGCESFQNRRNGWSGTGVRKASIRATDFHDMSGTAPEAGIDIEGGANTHIAFHDCRFYGNVLPFSNADGMQVTLDSCRIWSSTKRNVYLSGGNGAHCNCINTTIINAAVFVVGKTFLHGSTLRNCTITNGSPPADGTAWVASTAYAANAQVVPILANGFYYSTAGAATAGTTEPAWPTTLGSTVVDNGVTWTCAGYSNGVPELVVSSQCSYIDPILQLTPNLPNQIQFHGGSIMRPTFTNPASLAAPASYLFEGVVFNMSSSITTFRRGNYWNCAINIAPSCDLTVHEYSNLVNTDITRTLAASSRQLTFNQFCSIRDGTITDSSTLAGNIQCNNNVEMRGVRMVITRPVSNTKEAVFINGASVLFDDVKIDHTGTVNIGNSALIGLGSAASGFACRNGTLYASTASTPVIYTRSGTPTYDIFGTLMVGCVQPTSVPGTNRLAGNTVV